jgi:hypothetical protein
MNATIATLAAITLSAILGCTAHTPTPPSTNPLPPNTPKLSPDVPATKGL